MSAVERAVAAGGGQQELAKKIGIKYQAVQKWLRTGRVPPCRVIAVETITGVSRHELRPDIYPNDRPRQRSVAA